MDEIVQVIAWEFAAESKQIEHDVEAFLVDLESAGLVSHVGAAATTS
jgi:hypothetical protein